MTLPNTERRIVELTLRAYCRTKVPLHFSDRLRVGFRIAGNRVTLFEERPGITRPLNWAEIVVAQFRYKPSVGKWSLYYADRNSRWHPYEGTEPSEDLADLVDEVERDPTGIFWG